MKQLSDQGPHTQQSQTIFYFKMNFSDSFKGQFTSFNILINYLGYS